MKNSPVDDACLFSLHHYHTALTDWIGGQSTLSAEQLLEEMNLSEDATLHLHDGSKVLYKRGFLAWCSLDWERLQVQLNINV